MKFFQTLRSALWALTLLTAAAAAEPTAPETVLPESLKTATLLNAQESLFSAVLSGPDKGQARLSLIDTGDRAQPRCLQAEAATPCTVPWGMQIVSSPRGAFSKGDKITITWLARNGGTKTESGEVPAEFLLQGKRVQKYYARLSFLAGRGWQRYFLSFAAPEAAGDGELRAVFRIGMQPMRIDLAELRIYRFPAATPLTSLPVTRLTYAGREADAAWRKAAAARIEQIRKGTFKILVVDGAGQPVPNASLKIEMQKHAFPFGCVADEMSFGLTDPDHERMKQEFTRLFNQATVGRMTWICRWRPAAGYQAKRESTIAWVDRNGFARWHGAHLVWGGAEHLPPPILAAYQKRAATDKVGAADELRQAVKAQLRDVVTQYAGRVGTWNVVNEAYEAMYLFDCIGTGDIPEYFRIARQCDPQARLILNDYGILSHNGVWVDHQSAYFQLAQSILQAGAPLDGIGFQAHFGSQLTPPVRLCQVLDRFAALGVGLQATEFDVDIPDEQAQADYLRDFYTVLFSHPAVTAIEMWGFWEGDHWKPRAALWRKDWSIKPNGQAYLDLVFRDWWTRTAGHSGADGTCTWRGFYGSYRIVATQGGRTAEAAVAFCKTNALATITLR
jgi:GH35 family endo-1,4-beta-xylanase